MELIVLGAGSILPRAGYGCAGYALVAPGSAGLTLLDCGPGSLRMLGTLGLALERVERVLLTHFHTDHWLDLFALFFARRNPSLLAGDLEVVGPQGLAQRLADAPRALGPWIQDPKARVTEAVLDVHGRWSGAGGGLRYSCVPTLHSPEALCWRVEDERGAALLYSGDTGENERVAEHGRGVDLFLCECSFADEAAVEQHLTPSSAARLARAAGARRLLLTHFYPGLDPQAARERAQQSFDGPILCACDGLRLKVEQSA